MAERRIGVIDHYYPKVHAAVLDVQEGDLHVGDTVHIKGPAVEFTEKVTSLEIDHVPIEEAHKGDHVGLLVERPVRKAEVFVIDD